MSKVLSQHRLREVLVLLQIPLAWAVIRSFGVFDSSWYRSQYHNERNQKIQSIAPLIHYLLIGRRKGITPSPFFAAEYFDDRWLVSILDPLLKYLIKPSRWSRQTSIIFDPSNMHNKPSNLPPLAVYMKRVRKGSNELALDSRISPYINSSVDSTSLLAAIMKKVDIRNDQIKKHLKAATVNSFNFEKESDYIVGNSVEVENQPLVSIIMPVWNRRDLVQDAIRSIQAQTYQNWELLITDDGSTDDTVKVIQSYQKNDGRIKIFEPGHGGVCKARNHSLEHAKGRWVAFLDSDNTWTKDFLNVSIATLETDANKKASYSAIRMDNQGQIRYRTTKPNPELLQTGNYIDLNALVVEKALLDKIGYFDENLRRMVDYDLVCRIAKITDFVYVPVIGVNYTDHDDLVRISTSESTSWDGVVKSKNFIDWKSAHKNRKQNLVSIIIPIRGSAGSVVPCIEHLLKYTKEQNIEIILADASSNPSMNMTLAAVELLDNRIKHYREQACRDATLVTNYGFTHTSGDTVVVLNPSILVNENWLKPLLAEVDGKSIVSPLQLKPNRTINSAGVEFIGRNRIPVKILEDHPIQDTGDLPVSYVVEGIANGCFAARAKTFVLLNGTNPLYDGGFEAQDLSLRASVDHKVLLKVAKGSSVVNTDEGRGWYSNGQKQFVADWNRQDDTKTSSSLWGLAGFEVKKYTPLEQEHKELSRLRPVVKWKKQSTRWALKISAPPDERRFAWGDMYYANSLADALRRRGQSVTVDYLGAHDRPTSYLDDINIDIRGLTPFKPHAGTMNLLWVISHPDNVDPNSLHEFDIVYGAGKKWTDAISKTTNRNIKYLPQCTDASLFLPPKNPAKEFEGKVLFVGNSRNVFRPIVRDSIKAGLDVSIYGAGWDQFVDKKYIKSTRIANEDLSVAYGSAEVVLNDHWSDMAEWGFISNRLFDAAASGARIVSDNVSGATEIFGDSLYIYSGVNKLARLKDEGVISFFGNTKSRNRTAQKIRDEHSFDTRAKQIIEDVLAFNKATESKG